MNIYCCGCGKEVDALLGDGSRAYPHRDDLSHLPFWFCPACNNFVGCHHKTKDRTRPLGCIPTRELKNARQHIHRILDPLWKPSKKKRTKIYKQLSDKLGYRYHTAEIRSLPEARDIYRIVQGMVK